MHTHRNTSLQFSVAIGTLILCMLSGAPSVQSQPADVAVLPMTTTQKSLRIYRNAAPAALAAKMTSLVGMPVRAVSSAADVPKNARVIIDGRLVDRGDEKLQIEVQVRRATTGRPLATVASGVASATDIDRLVGQLAIALGPVLRKALVAERFVLPTTVVRPERGSGAQVMPAQAAQPPSILLVPATGQAAQGMVEVREPATQAAAHMLQRLGLSIGHIASADETVNPLKLVGEMRTREIPLALAVQVLSVKFSYASVLSARGRVRVILIGQDGLPLVDVSVKTDTVVGGRGDRHQALVYRVVEQALDIARPRFVRSVTRHIAQPGGGV